MDAVSLIHAFLHMKQAKQLMKFRMRGNYESHIRGTPYAQNADQRAVDILDHLHKQKNKLK